MLKVNTRNKAVSRRGEERRGDSTLPAVPAVCWGWWAAHPELLQQVWQKNGHLGMNEYTDGDRKGKIWETRSASRLVSFILCIVSTSIIFSTIFYIFKAAAFSSPDCNTLSCFRCHRWKYNGGLVRKTTINPSMSYLQENIWKVC